MLKKYLNKRKSIEKNSMLQSIIGIGDILVYEVNRNNDERIISTLKKLYELMENLFSIKKSNIKKFDRLILSEAYFDLSEKNMEEAQFNLSFYPEKYADGFEAIVSQVTRLYKKAVEENNINISMFSIYTLNKILKFLSSEDENNLFIDQILRKSSDIILESVNKNDLRIFSSAIDVYKDIVLENNFKLDYLKSFDNYLFSSAKYVVTQNRLDFFKELTSRMTDGVFSGIQTREVWDYGHLLLQDFELYSVLDKQFGIENRLKYLDDSSTKIYSDKDLEKWLNEYGNLKNIVENNLKKSELNKAKKIENSILKSIYNKFKSNNIKNLFFSIGAFCLFDKKINFIKFLWRYKQPEDADAIWISHDLTPENLNELMTVYFDLMDGGINFFVGHHGSNVYIKQYFLLLLGRLLQNTTKGSLNYKPESSYRLPDLDIYKLSDLTHRCDNLIEDVKKLMLSKNILSELEFENPEELFNNKIIPFIEHVKSEAEKQISVKHKNFPVSEPKIEKFKSQVVKKFYDLAAIRDILTNYFYVYKYVNDVKPVNDKAILGLNVVVDKAVFFESWHIHYSNWQDSFARSLSSGEDNQLFTEIMNQCQLSTMNNFEDILAISGSLSDLVIITSGVNIWKYFEGKKQFKAGWRNDVEKLPIQGFNGWLEHSGIQIPIFGITNSGQEDIILILNKAKFGWLYQYSPLNNEMDLSLGRDIFYMNIKLLTERKDLIEKFKLEPPEWLIKAGDDAVRQAYIQERVVIEIYEKFEFIPSDDFLGYKWKII